MVNKIEAGKRYRVDMNKLPSKGSSVRACDVEKYSDNGIVLISAIYSYTPAVGKWEFKKNNGEKSYWHLNIDELLPLREEAFLEIFKDELKFSE